MPNGQSCVIETAMSPIIHYQKGSRILVSFNEAIERFCESLVRLCAWNQILLNLEAVGLPKNNGKLIYLDIYAEVIVFPAQ